MKKIGVIIIGVIILAVILVLTVFLEILEFFAGAILFFVAIGVLVYLFNKVKDKID